jgi:hypothetical protein
MGSRFLGPTGVHLDDHVRRQECTRLHPTARTLLWPILKREGGQLLLQVA